MIATSTATLHTVETFQAAIDKLERERDAATGGPWWIFEPDSSAIYGSSPTGGEHHVLDAANGRRDRDLIVTLHRTIDA